MAQSTRQTNLLVQQDWTKIYQTFTNADFTSYDFETLRSSMINYLKTYYPETFNDFLESSEYLALIDMIAFLGQSLSFRADLNARENFIDTAQRRDSILKLARMLSYNPQRTASSSGLLKIESIKTTESIKDSTGINLSNATVHWNDVTNDNWLEQFTTILNAALISNQTIGKPGNSQAINGVQTDEYSVALNTNTLPIAQFKTNIQNTPITFEAVSATTVGESYIYEVDPTVSGKFNILYRNDNNGNGSNNTGFFVYFKQGTLQSTQFNIQNSIPNNFVNIASNNINQTDHWLYGLDVAGNPQTFWSAVPALSGVNVTYNQLSNKNLYQINTLTNDRVNLVFGDGGFSNIPQGQYRFYYRTSNGSTYSITPNDMSTVNITLPYVGQRGTLESLSISASLKYTVTNATAAQTLSSIKTYAPQQYYTQNRMITAEDYNIFPQTTFTSIQKIKAVNRSSSGVSLYLDAIDPTGSYSSTNIFGDDGIISSNTAINSNTFDFLNSNDIYSAIYDDVIPLINSAEMRNYYYANFTRYTPPHANVAFNQTGNTTVSSNGYLTYNNTNQQVGEGISGNLQYVTVGSSLKFLNGSDVHYASVTNVVANDNLTTPGLITFGGTIIPSGAVLQSIIPAYKNDISNSLISTLVAQVKAHVNFGLTYDQANQRWINITPSNIGTSSDWLIKFTYNQGSYVVSYKNLIYTFASAGNTKFYFDPTTRVYSSTIGTNVTDTVKVLKINTKPGLTTALDNDVVWQIYNTITEIDGYVDNTRVHVKSPESQMDSVPDNPDLYSLVANSDNRGGMYFQYKHNVPSRNRIDPTPVNIIDLYILTAEYSKNYISWLQDLTGTIKEPTAPTSTSLELAYNNLDNYKTVSDSLVYNPAKFKPLFGAKADRSLRAKFQVVKNPAANITDNEVKSQVIKAINSFFDITNWDFGDTFYFSELAAYLHSTLAPNIASVIIVPTDTTLVFGNYFQINAEPWEIIASAATVNDVEIITAVTSAQLNLPSSTDYWTGL